MTFHLSYISEIKCVLTYRNMWMTTRCSVFAGGAATYALKTLIWMSFFRSSIDCLLTSLGLLTGKILDNLRKSVTYHLRPLKGKLREK